MIVVLIVLAAFLDTGTKAASQNLPSTDTSVLAMWLTVNFRSVAATLSQSDTEYQAVLSMFDIQRHSRHSGGLAGRVPTRSGHTLVMSTEGRP
jgi:hypothetical protein